MSILEDWLVMTPAALEPGKKTGCPDRAERLKQILARHHKAADDRDEGERILRRVQNYLVHGDPGITYRKCGGADFDEDGHCDCCRHELLDDDQVRLIREARALLQPTQQAWKSYFIAVRLNRQSHHKPLLPR
jgi:hypothetical protein